MSYFTFCVVAALMLLSGILKGLGEIIKQNDTRQSGDS